MEVDSYLQKALPLLISRKPDSAEKLKEMLFQSLGREYIPPTFVPEESTKPDAVTDSTAEDEMDEIAAAETDTEQAMDADDFAFDMGISCVICRQFDVSSNNQLIECKDCHSLYHQLCHKPPVNDSSDANWSCHKCTKHTKKAEKSSKKSSTKTEGTSEKTESKKSESSKSDGTRSLLASDRKIKERNKEAKAAERKSEKREKDKKSSSGEPEKKKAKKDEKPEKGREEKSKSSDKSKTKSEHKSKRSETKDSEKSPSAADKDKKSKKAKKDK